ncbi:MAG: rhomboid family intramembrane serine protease [Nitrososphaerota archaeon]|nr:rhomboid family intramembrane serine protease [Nitrososphaerota archaeon]MDG6942972.1 rhomboid family intramembrane serine protease [Nitrososphaerota archaeon]MDG6950700.1 rhomboid family intramembrane serine protease [Nitrososphaerota archaeon]
MTFIVVGGLVVGTAFAFVNVDGVPLTYILLQFNGLVARGWVWQIVTSIVIAPPTWSGLLDVGFNAMALVWLDGFFTLTYSKNQYYAVFLLTAITGNVMSLANGPRAASFGASGGIFGLLAGVISFDLVTSRRLDLTLVSWFVVVFLVSSFLFASVDWLAHLGGAIAGLALGYALGANRRRKEDSA